jgi:hypothetical protein
MKAPIDRRALVARHNVVIDAPAPLNPLTVGNGGAAGSRRPARVFCAMYRLPKVSPVTASSPTTRLTTRAA